MVDTSLYPPSYQQKLLTLLSEEWDLDANTDGVLIHSDNFQALNLLQARYREQVKCIYIDPPYNTGNDGFIYKDNYQHSSWLTTMENRLQAAYPLLRQDGVNFISIDDNEQARAKEVSDFIFGEKNFIANVIWQKNILHLMMQNGSRITTTSLLLMPKIKKFGDLIYCLVQKKQRHVIKILTMTQEEFGNQEICLLKLTPYLQTIQLRFRVEE